jgi:hypothetical protein
MMVFTSNTCLYKILYIYLCCRTKRYGYNNNLVLVSLDEYNAMARTASVLTSTLGADVMAAARKQEFIEVDIDSL